MKPLILARSTIMLAFLSLCSALAQQPGKLADNAALRYWAAIAQMQDSAISDQQAKELNAIFDGTVPYDDAKYKELVEKNKPALETIARAAAIKKCDWGLDFELGPDTPVDYVRKALPLGRLNVLYAFHLLAVGNNDEAVRVLASGLHFSRDVSNGGTLLATVVAKKLLVAHLKATQFTLQKGSVSGAQKLILRAAIAQLGSQGLDWQSAMNRELQLLQKMDSPGDEALRQIIPVYLAALRDPKKMTELQGMINAAPQSIRDVIPNPTRVLQEKQDLSDKLAQVQSLLL